MKVVDFCRSILEGEDLKSKLEGPLDLCFDDPSDQMDSFDLTSYPKRPKELQISEKKLKFPAKGTLGNDHNRAKALHFFANHELLAIEMMAAALLIFPQNSSDLVKLKKGILEALCDEQKHLRLYIARMNELGIDFGDFPVNGFFWEKMKDLNTPAKYLCGMALTFEAANLDFSYYYGNLFDALGDKKSAQIMNIIYTDEITHVALGRKFLNDWKKNQTLWQYYLSELPFPLTPARSIGIELCIEARKKVGLGDDFIEKISNYQDDFSITTRKEWKK